MASLPLISATGTAAAHSLHRRAVSSIPICSEATVDAESSTTPNAAATADGADEDGLIGTPVMTAGTTNFMTFATTNNTGAAAYLNVWIDFNNDGDFNDAGEQPVDDSSVATGTNTHYVETAVPGGAVTGVGLGIRVRLNSIVGVAATGAAGSGEVEDYLVTVRPFVAPPCARTDRLLVWNVEGR